jgi:hypothetical protein
MRAIVHSIHSQVPGTVAALNQRYDTILSLDSHHDVSLGGDYGVYPEGLRMIAKRTSVHADLRDVSGGVAALKGHPPARGSRPEVIVAIPERMLARHASDVELKLPPDLRMADLAESISSVVEFLRTTVGIEVYASPPRALTALVPRMHGPGPWLLDVDVDYMREMQEECYTQIRRTAPGVLQSVSNVVGFIEDTRPETITISEVMVSAIRDEASNFSGFRRALEAIGYEIEERGIYQNDQEVLDGIAVCREFYDKVSTRLMIAHMDAMMRGEFGSFEREERDAARAFFRSRGYTV